MIATVLLVVAIGSALSFPRAKGGARLFCGLVMLASLAGFMVTIAQSAHPGL